ncbi:MAG: deiodinase family protein [Pirellulales bacterium]
MLRTIIICFLTVQLASNFVEIAVSQEPTSARPVNDWIRTGKSRFNSAEVISKYDRNGDQQISVDEWPLKREIFDRIDRDWSGTLSAVDFEWSKDGVLGKQKETTFALFKSVDTDSNGRISAEEWKSLFEKGSGDLEYLNEERLEQLIYQPRVIKTAKEETLRKGRTEYSPTSLAAMPVPQPGQVAPDFELSSPDGSRTVRLSQFRGNKPVVLVFGCYTCGNYRTYSSSIEELYEFWSPDVEFLRVYVREAHPTDDSKPATSTNKQAGILFKQPETLKERCQIATQFTASMNITTPIVVDGIDNQVGQDYGAWPDRLYIIDRNGVVAFTGGPGPFGFNPREMEQSLVMLTLDEVAKLPK